MAATHGTWVAPILLVALVLGSLWYGQAPPRSPEEYQKRASDTAEFLHSQLATAQLWTAQRPARAFDPSTVVGVEEAERDATVTLDRFGGFDPPPGTEELRSRLTGLGDEAVTLLGEMRIAAHRGDWDRLESLARRAREPATALERLSVEVRPG